MKDAIAKDTINPCRFLTRHKEPHWVRQARTGEPICGVSQRYPKYPVVDSETAAYGDGLFVIEHGQRAKLELGSDCCAGDFLQSDDEGRGIVPGMKDGDYYGGYAHQSGKAGDIIEIFVQCGQVGELIARQGPL